MYLLPFPSWQLPVVPVTGDPQQVQPIQNNENRVEQVPNTFGEKKFYSLVNSYCLKKQYGVLDKYNIRYWTLFLTLFSSKIKL